MYLEQILCGERERDFPSSIQIIFNLRNVHGDLSAGLHHTQPNRTKVNRRQIKKERIYMNAQQLNSTQPDTSFSKNILLFLLLLRSVAVFIHSRSKFYFSPALFSFSRWLAIQLKFAESERRKKKRKIFATNKFKFINFEFKLNLIWIIAPTTHERPRFNGTAHGVQLQTDKLR